MLKENNLNWRWIFVVVLLLGGLGYALTKEGLRLTRELQSRGAKTQGRVVKKYDAPHKFDFEYHVANKKFEKARVMVPSDVYPSLNENSVVDLLYLPEDPSKVMVAYVPLACEHDLDFAHGILLVGIIGSAYLGLHFFLKSKAIFI